MARRTWDQLCADLRDLAQEYAERIHETRGRNPDAFAGDAEVTEIPAGSTLVIRLPAHYDPHIAADLLRFTREQAAAAGVTLPVIVTLGEAVAAQAGT